MTTENTSSISEGFLKEFPVPTFEEWLKAVEVVLKGVPFEKKLVSKTIEGITIQPLYTKQSGEKLSASSSLPGFTPYVRGTKASGLRSGWNITQNMRYASPEEFNEVAHSDLPRGLSALTLSLDMLSRRGKVPSASNCDGFGQEGTSISSKEDLAKALKGVDLTKTPLYLQVGEAGIPALAFLAGYISDQNKDLADLKGALLFDPAQALLSEGTLETSTKHIFDELAALTNWAILRTSGFRTVSVNAKIFTCAGAHAVQELGYAMALGVTYLRELTSRRIPIDEAANAITFEFSVGSDFFMEIAKFRAARLLWAQIVKACGGNSDAQKAHIVATTTRWNKTKFDPYVNMLRLTSEAFAAVLGEVDTLLVSPFDELYGPAGEFSRRIARNVQIILQEESNLDKVIDPAAGSYYVEQLTSELSKKSWELMQSLEAEGGIWGAIQKGTVQAQVAETAKARKTNVARRKDVIVGTNMYANLGEKQLPDTRPDYTKLAGAKAKELEQAATKRNTAKLDSALKNLSPLSSATIDFSITAASEGATIAEITSAIRKGITELVKASPLAFGRAAEGYEELRLKAESFKEKGSRYPQVFLANMGPVAQYKARADYTSGFFQPGGFSIVGDKSFATPEEAADAAIASGCEITVICSTDDTYPDLVPAFTKRIKEKKPNLLVIVAGYPEAHVEAFKASGVDDFIHIRSDNFASLKSFQQKIGLN